MRRWMAIITLAALVIALVAGWGIGRLAGGGSGDSISAVRAIPTLEPTATVQPSPSRNAPTMATAPATDLPATPVIAPGSPTETSPEPAIQRPTSIPDTP